MPYLNLAQRVLEAKIVYYGAGLSGKTTNLKQIRELCRDGACGELVSLNTDGDRTLFFDWLPVSLGKVNGCDLKIQLYTVPGQAKYKETRRQVLSDADAVVLVLDSQAASLERNREILGELRQHLVDHRLEKIPLVVQLNKQDLPGALTAEAALQELGLQGLPAVPACATSGTGVMETLREAALHTIRSIRDVARQSPSSITAHRSPLLDGGPLYRRILEAQGPQAGGHSESGSLPSDSALPPREGGAADAAPEATAPGGSGAGAGVAVRDMQGLLQAFREQLQASERRQDDRLQQLHRAVTQQSDAMAQLGLRIEQLGREAARAKTAFEPKHMAAAWRGEHEARESALLQRVDAAVQAVLSAAKDLLAAQAQERGHAERTQKSLASILGLLMGRREAGQSRVELVMRSVDALRTGLSEQTQIRQGDTVLPLSGWLVASVGRIERHLEASQARLQELEQKVQTLREGVNEERRRWWRN